MKITQKDAVGLFVGLGLKNAGKWNLNRMAAKLGKVKDMVDEDVELEEPSATILRSVLAAIDAGEEFEVVAEDEQTTQQDVEKQAPAKEEKEEKQQDQKADEKPVKKDGPKLSRPAACGIVLARHGLDKTSKIKVTKELADEVDALYGRANTNESMFCLRNAVNAIIGYLAELDANNG